MGGDRQGRSKIGKLTRRRPFSASSHAAPRPRGIFSLGYASPRHNTDSEEDSESARRNANDWSSDDSCFSSDPPSPTESNESDLWGDSVGSAVSDQPPYLCDDKCFEVPSTTACGPVDQYSPKADGPSTVAAGISPYTPIRPWQFRILELFPGKGGATPRGRLIPVTLTLQQGRYCAVSGPIDHGKILHYRALSYTWGRSAADRFLELNDGAIPITKNLHGALLHLRDAEASRYVWVDAVCIDQTSFSERGQQVSNMLQIFQTADGVDVWLGDSLDDSDLAMAYLDLNRIDRNSPHGWRTYHSEVCMEHAATLRGPLVRLFARPWLRRTWIRQEVYAARELIVHCGSRTVTWDCFLNGLAVARFLVHRLDFGESEFETNQYYRAAHQLAQELETNTETLPSTIKSSRDFPAVLSTAHHYGATDERDAAYAVLGMCSVDISVADGDRLNKRKRSITVDYTRSIDEVWTDVAVYILSDPKTRLSKSGKLPEHIANIFNLTDLPPDRQRAIASRNDFDLAPGAPAWVFDWHSRRNLNDMNLLRDVLGPGDPGDLRYHLYPRFFRELHAKDEYFRHSPPRAIDEQRLRVRAYIVGVVGEVTNRTCSFDAFIKRLMRHQQRHSAALKDFASRKLQESSDTRCLARIRTKARAGQDMKVRDRSCVALVPIAARPGDLVVTIASNVLPLVITPRTKGSPQLDGLHVGSRMSSQYHDSDDEAGEIGALRPDWLLLGPVFGNMRLAGPSFGDSREFMLH